MAEYTCMILIKYVKIIMQCPVSFSAAIHKNSATSRTSAEKIEACVASHLKHAKERLSKKDQIDQENVGNM